MPIHALFLFYFLFFRMMLDSIARMVDGSVSGIDDTYFNTLVDCMQQATNLVESHDGKFIVGKKYHALFLTPYLVVMNLLYIYMCIYIAAWAGFKSYYDTNGTDTDSWGACTAEAGCKQYKENNLTAVSIHLFIIPPSPLK
jgi:hypothetical protein